MGKERVAKWDNVKLVLMACVVIGHMLAGYLSSAEGVKSIYFFIYTFHMPAFIFVSGLMMKGTVKNKRYEKIFSYLLMFLLIKAVMFGAKWLALGKHGFSLFNMDDVSWYAFAVFIFALLMVFLQRFSPVYVFTLSIIVALIAGYDDSIGTYLSLSRIIVFYPFFLAGFYLDSGKLLDFTKKPAAKCASAAILIATAVICFVKLDSVYKLLPLLKGKASYDALNDLRLYGFFLRAGFYAAAFLIVMSVIILIPNVKTFLTSIGSRTLSIYTLHFALIYIIRDGLKVNRLLKAISADYYMYLAIIVALIILFVTSIKPVNTFITKLINPSVLKAKEEK